MTDLKKQKDWLINIRGRISVELYTITCIINSNDKHNGSYVVLVKCIKQLQATVIKFMKIYIQLHSYFRDVLHDLNAINHIVNILICFHIPKIVLCLNWPITLPINSSLKLFSLQHKYHHLKQQILYLNVWSLLTAYHTNKYIKSLQNEIDSLWSLLETSQSNI